jgi:hypothetical protein
LPQTAAGVQPTVQRMLQEVLAFVEAEGKARGA